jgi:hypothetical protein
MQAGATCPRSSVLGPWPSWGRQKTSSELVKWVRLTVSERISSISERARRPWATEGALVGGLRDPLERLQQQRRRDGPASLGAATLEIIWPEGARAHELSQVIRERTRVYGWVRAGAQPGWRPTGIPRGRASAAASPAQRVTQVHRREEVPVPVVRHLHSGVTHRAARTDHAVGRWAVGAPARGGSAPMHGRRTTPSRSSSPGSLGGAGT